MSPEQPSSAPDTDTDTVTPRDDDTVASVLRDTASDARSGGGGLGPRSAATNAGAHGTAPNAPIDTGLPDAEPSAEARRRAADPS